MSLIIAITIGYILLCLLGLFVPGFWGLAVVACVIGFVLFMLYILVKKAVKDALREYGKEKAKQNGPQ